MATAGLAADPALQQDAVSSEESGYAAAKALLTRGQAFDAIFAGSDLIAIGAMRSLAEAGLRCPHDVALIGFDDIPAASQTSPTLTTVMQDMKGAGELLIDALLRRIDGDDAERTMLPARLIKRQSTAV
jgi:DNA-binding LacI/PurR family transcriptional regulator